MTELDDVMTEEVLISVFKALKKSQIKYCLLRGAAELPEVQSFKEIDILVAARNLSNFATVVSELGFVPLPSWGYAPHHFFVAFDKANDAWLKLDVVTDLAYGRPVRFLHVPLANRCLEKRIQDNEVYVLSVEHELITLILHCVLDKGEFRVKHRQRLMSLKETYLEDEEVIKQTTEAYVEQILPETLTWDDVISAIDSEDWQRLLREQGAIAQKLLWNAPLSNLWHKFFAGVCRQMRPVFYLLRRHGLSIALLAPDGAGKTTLAKALSSERILRARRIYMGTNLDTTTVGLPTTNWLKGRLKAGDMRKGKVERALLKAMNFTNRVVEQWLRYGVGVYHKCVGRFVIFDRYAYDSLLAPPAKTLGKRLRRAFLLKTCPTPDLVVLLDAPGELLFERKGEHSPEFLEKQRQQFLRLKDRIPNLIIVDATSPPNEVRREAISRIWNLYRTC